jgi:putative transposase
MMMFWGLLAEAWSAHRDARVRFLMAQMEMLRDRVPGNRVILTPEERARLLKLGESVGHETDDLIGIVSVKPHKCWLREQRSAAPGRSRHRCGK